MKSPTSGAEMIAQPAPDERAMIKAMIDAGSSAAYATNFVKTHLEKEKALGTLYRDPVTGYTMRVKPGDADDRFRKVDDKGAAAARQPGEA